MYLIRTHPPVSVSVLSCPSLSGFISNLTIQRQNFPTDEDQTGAAKALLRLQDTYRLDANTISIGDLPGKSLTSVHTTRHTSTQFFFLGSITMHVSAMKVTANTGHVGTEGFSWFLSLFKCSRGRFSFLL